MFTFTTSPPTVPGPLNVSSSDTIVTPSPYPISDILMVVGTVPGKSPIFANASLSYTDFGNEYMVISPDANAAVIRPSGNDCGKTKASAEPS